VGVQAVTMMAESSSIVFRKMPGDNFMANRFPRRCRQDGRSENGCQPLEGFAQADRKGQQHPLEQLDAEFGMIDGRVKQLSSRPVPLAV